MEDLTSALWTAALKGDYDLASQLICRGANPNEPRIIHYLSIAEITLLHYATIMVNVKLMRLLINHGANCNARDSLMCTPLQYAVRTKDCPDVVEELINGGADPNVQMVSDHQFYQCKPLHAAVARGFNQSAQVLIARGASLEEQDRMYGWNALHFAVRYNNLKMVEVLISHGVNVDVETRKGDTSLHSAVCNKSIKTDTIQLLLDNGADVNRKSRNGKFPVYLAGLYNYSAALCLLIKRGARINETMTNLTVCTANSKDVARLLVKFGANMNASESIKPFKLLKESPSSEATAQAIISEAVKREELGQSLCEGYKQMAQSCENYSKFYDMCREEVKRMRSERVDLDSTAWFFDIFSKSEEKLATIVRNRKIVTALKTSEYLTSFRIYGFDLSTNLRRAKRRAHLLIRSEDSLDEVLGYILPSSILQKIAAYVEYDDIIDDEMWRDCYQANDISFD